MADVVGDAEHLPIGSATADSILCTEVLEHVRHPEAVVTEIFRALKPGGALLLTAPMSWNLHYEPNDYRRYTCYGLWQLLKAHGFRVVATRRIGGLFSLVGSRLVDGIATELYTRLKFLPPRVRHGVILLYSIPTSLVFMVLARLGDDFQRSDALGWAILARKPAS
jgi:SAM-dependent methyltransferase